MSARTSFPFTKPARPTSPAPASPLRLDVVRGAATCCGAPLEEDFDHDAMRCPVCGAIYPLSRVLALLDQALRGLSDLQLTLAQEHITFCAGMREVEAA